MVREPSIALKTIMTFSEKRVKQRSSDLEDEAPLIQDQRENWVEVSSIYKTSNLYFSIIEK